MATIHAQLIYAKDLPIYQREKPYQILSRLPNLTNTAPSNPEFEAVEEVIEDIRLGDRRFTLDNNGFCHAIAPTCSRTGILGPRSRSITCLKSSRYSSSLGMVRTK
jgi:hypothetical protein